MDEAIAGLDDHAMAWTMTKSGRRGDSVIHLVVESADWDSVALVTISDGTRRVIKRCSNYPEALDGVRSIASSKMDGGWEFAGGRLSAHQLRQCEELGVDPQAVLLGRWTMSGLRIEQVRDHIKAGWNDRREVDEYTHVVSAAGVEAALRCRDAGIDGDAARSWLDSGIPLDEVLDDDWHLLDPGVAVKARDAGFLGGEVAVSWVDVLHRHPDDRTYWRSCALLARDGVPPAWAGEYVSSQERRQRKR